MNRHRIISSNLCRTRRVRQAAPEPSRAVATADVDVGIPRDNNCMGKFRVPRSHHFFRSSPFFFSFSFKKIASFHPGGGNCCILGESKTAIFKLDQWSVRWVSSPSSDLIPGRHRNVGWLVSPHCLGWTPWFFLPKSQLMLLKSHGFWCRATPPMVFFWVRSDFSCWSDHLCSLSNLLVKYGKIPHFMVKLRETVKLPLLINFATYFAGIRRS